MSELKELMRDAAAEAVVPLEARIEELQARIEDMQEMPRMLEAPDAADRIEIEESRDERAEKTVGRRQRVR
jgi:hypothetical protein